MFAGIQLAIYLVISLGAAVCCVWALVDCLSRKPAVFVAAGKRSKALWLVVTGLASALAILCVPPPVGLAVLSPLYAIFAAGAGLLYLVDVRPAVKAVSGRGGRGGGRSGRGPGGRSSGW